MTHNEIYTKFMIEYDKANVTSSYPSLTKYEAATLLDRAYLTLISRKLTGNNTRRVPFEYDTKAIEDLRPLVTTKRFEQKGKSRTVSNEYKFAIPEDLMYYIEGVANYGSEREIVLPVNHQIARKFKLTNSNFPWVNHPVSYIEGSEVYVLIDPFLHETGPNLDGTYIKKPASFVVSLTQEEELEENGNDSGNNNPPSGNDDIPEGDIPENNDPQGETKKPTADNIIWRLPQPSGNYTITSPTTFEAVLLFNGREYKCYYKIALIGNANANSITISELNGKCIVTPVTGSAPTNPSDPGTLLLLANYNWTDGSIIESTILIRFYTENDNQGDDHDDSNSLPEVKISECTYIEEPGIINLKYNIYLNLYTRPIEKHIYIRKGNSLWLTRNSFTAIVTQNMSGEENISYDSKYREIVIQLQDPDDHRRIIASASVDISNISSSSSNTGNQNNNSLQTESFEYVDLGLPSGTKWAKWNVGATSETEKGGYYGWGDPTGKKIAQGQLYGEMYMENLTVAPYPASLTEPRYQYLDIAHVISNGECHIPTSTLMKELVDNCTFVYTLNYNGIVDLNGYIVRKKNTTNSNYIFLPAIGFRSGVNINGNGEPIFPQEYKDRCFYWSADVTANTNVYGWGIYYEFPSNEEKHLMTFYGLPIRPVKDARL